MPLISGDMHFFLGWLIGGGGTPCDRYFQYSSDVSVACIASISVACTTTISGVALSRFVCCGSWSFAHTMSAPGSSGDAIVPVAAKKGCVKKKKAFEEGICEEGKLVHSVH